MRWGELGQSQRWATHSIEFTKGNRVVRRGDWNPQVLIRSGIGPEQELKRLAIPPYGPTTTLASIFKII